MRVLEQQQLIRYFVFATLLYEFLLQLESIGVRYGSEEAAV